MMHSDNGFSAAAGERVFSLLVAEDDDDDYLLTCQALRLCGFTGKLDRVNDGSALIARLSDGLPDPDLVFLDLNMPREDGREALRKMRADPRMRSIPVLIMTTSKSDGDVRLAYQLGANAFVQKPFEFSRFVDVIRVSLDFWRGVAVLPPKEARV